MEFEQVVIRRRNGTLDLTQSEIEQYSTIGYVLSEFSRLEFVMDQLAFKLAESEGDFCHSISKKFPQQIIEKIRFTTSAIKRHPKLSKIEDADGVIDTERFEKAMEYVFRLRNIIVHGANYFTNTEEGRTEYSFKKFSRLRLEQGANSGTFSEQNFIISTPMLEHALSVKSYLNFVLSMALRVLDGVDTWEEARKMSDGRREFRDRLMDMRSKGIEIDDPFGLLDGVLE